MLRVLAEAPVMRSGDAGEIERLLTRAATVSDVRTGVFLVGPDGTIRHSNAGYSEAEGGFSDRGWFSQVTESRDITVGGFIKGRVSEEPIVPIAYPVTDGQGELLYIAATGVQLNWVEEHLAMGIAPEGTSVVFRDEEGTILGRFGSQLPEERELASIIAGTGGTNSNRPASSIFRSLDDSGRRRLAAVAPVGRNALDHMVEVVASVPVSRTANRADQQLVMMAGWLLLITTVAVLGVWLSGGRWVLEPLAALNHASRQLAYGEEVDNWPDGGAPREIRLLRNSFERMSESIEQRERSLEQQLYWSQLLGNLADAIAEHQTMSSILQVAIRQLVESFDAAAGAISTRYGEDNRETLTTVIVEDPRLQRAWNNLEEREIPVTSREVQEHFEPNEPYTIRYNSEEINALPSGYRGILRYAQEQGLLSGIILPVMTDETHLGTLWLSFADRNAFSPAETNFLKRLGSHISIAIQHSAAQKELEKTQKAAMQKERLNAMGQMASGIAHDINNSLMPITSYADLVLQREDELSEKSTRFINTIKDAA